MAMDLLNAILASQGSIKPSNPMENYNLGSQMYLNQLENGEKGRIINSRDQTENLLANNDYKGALTNAQGNGDMQMANSILGRINQNRNVLGGAAYRLSLMPQEKRQAALEAMTPQLQEQGIDPSSIPLDDYSLNAIGNMPLTTQEQQTLGINTANAQSNNMRAQADMQNSNINAQYRPLEVGIKQRQADIASRNADINAVNAQTNIDKARENHYQFMNPILKEGETSNVVEYDGSTPQATSPYDQPNSATTIVPSKPISQMTNAELNDFQTKMINNTKGNIGQGNLGTSAVGLGQFTLPTRNAMLKQAFPDLTPEEHDNLINSPEVQAKVLNTQVDGIMNSNKTPARALKQTFASLSSVPDGILNNLDSNSIKKMIASGENGYQLSDGEIEAGDNLVKPPIRRPDGTIEPAKTKLPAGEPDTILNPVIPSNQNPPENPPSTFKGLPVIRTQDQERDFAQNGGGMAYRPQGNGYVKTNIKQEKPTTDQMTMAGYYNDTHQALNTIHELNAEGFNSTNVPSMLVRGARVGPDVLKKAQRFQNAINNIVELRSRMLSGAAMGEEERKRMMEQFTPMVTDTPEVAAQKMLQIEAFDKSLYNRAHGKVETDPTTSLENERDGIQQAVLGKDFDALQSYKSRLGAAYVSNVIRDLSTKRVKPTQAPLTPTQPTQPQAAQGPILDPSDYQKLLNARTTNDTDTFNRLANKYGQEKLGLALRNNNQN